MSTRCQIGIYENNQQNLLRPSALIYRHSDGYPEGAGKDLAVFAREFDRVRGMDDSEYFTASLIAFLKMFHCGRPLEERSHMMEFVGGLKIAPTGHGVGNTIHTDIEYFYRVNCAEREIIFYEAHLPYSSTYGESNFKEIKRLSVKAKKDRHALA